jgi:high-affinity iron transporter
VLGLLQTFFLSFREVFEAALLVGIILTYLKQSGRDTLIKYVLYGTFGGVIASLIVGLLSYLQMSTSEGAEREFFEALMKLIASVLITYVVVWIGRQNKNIAKNLKENVDRRSSSIGLFSLAFISVLREGIELVVFTLASIGKNSFETITGILIGLVLAVGLVFAMFKYAIKINIKRIFKFLGVVLIVLGAEMFGEGIVDLFEIAGEFYELLLIGIYFVSMIILFFDEDLKRIFSKA